MAGPAAIRALDDCRKGVDARLKAGHDVKRGETAPYDCVARSPTVATPAPMSRVPPTLLTMPIARGLRTTLRAREATSA